ncbi:clathrin-coated vesicle protein [Grosmannia clavigera kw1407]|uniref:Clathrin-coated vesicle protein n=1 Tax=Grosmannia clavigera (strain kw1407 / UAMH 11150) TaxID=655863 RepID=F0XJG6_GROCL|nr:clathrin-coated vesicle protein [Grosmannia clavigera kw1407]EFX02390.1 clathrin-coated vesicle protein [Grosmannia clavigera kw1407]
MVAPAVPEITEEEVHESVESRTEQLLSLRELGPPDLVHLVRQPIRGTGRHIGVYHHVTGVDASSSASLAAYINTLTYREPGTTATTKISEGLYCCYNALSRLDMRVHVTIPGTVESYCVDERGEKKKASDELWLETYLCSVLRAYSYADDGSGETIRKIMGVRRFNPVTNTETEHRFLNAAEQLFFRGWQLGSDATVQVPTVVSNHLVSGLLKYFETTGRYASGINLFQKLRTQNVEVASLLAKVLFMGNEEVDGVRVLHRALQEEPMDYVMLDTQAAFLLRKARTAATAEQKEQRLRMALGCADRSTVAAPSEFGTWARLAEVYVAQEDWENALTILNSCPMFTYQDKDSPQMPEPKEVSLPILPETRLDELDGELDSRYNDQVDPSLLGLRAAAYRGTFKHAYNILTEMTAKIGWDQLLKIRSNVFVMEDEYRTEKKEGSIASYPVTQQAAQATDALRGTPDPQTNGHDDGDDTGSAAESESSADEDDDASKIEGDDRSGVEKPSTAADAGEKEEHGTAIEEHLSRLNNKRLCERWLDSLFMVLYEDLRVYTIWRTQMAQYRAQQMQYKKSAEEWEILGLLAERLQHADEAVEAYRACLAQRFSPRAMSGILRALKTARAGSSRTGSTSNGHGNANGTASTASPARAAGGSSSHPTPVAMPQPASTAETVASVIRLVTWQYRWYSGFSPQLLQTVRVLIEDEGAVKVGSLVQATNLPQHRYGRVGYGERRENGERTETECNDD